jgi:hypothetical protein
MLDIFLGRWGRAIVVITRLKNRPGHDLRAAAEEYNKRVEAARKGLTKAERKYGAYDQRTAEARGGAGRGYGRHRGRRQRMDGFRRGARRLGPRGSATAAGRPLLRGAAHRLHRLRDLEQVLLAEPPRRSLKFSTERWPAGPRASPRLPGSGRRASPAGRP